MQSISSATQPNSPRQAPSKTDVLRKRIDELATQGIISSEKRHQLKDLLVRIDLSSASPFGQEFVPKQWDAVAETLEATRQEQILVPKVDEELRRIISVLQETEVSWNRPLNVSVCQICGLNHKLKVRKLSFARPDAWSYLSPADKESRCMGDDNFLAIDNRRFFIRGILPVRIEDQVINIQTWAEVDQKYFAQFIDTLLANVGQRQVKAFPTNYKGVLANRLLPQEENIGEAIDIACNDSLLPKLWLTDSANLLWLAQHGHMDSEATSILFSSFAHSQYLHENLPAMLQKFRA